MKKKIICAILTLIMMLCIVCPAAYAETEDALAIQSKSVLLMELESGTVLYEKNADEMLRPASVTKVMTLLLIFEALERGDIALDDTVVVTEHAASMGGSQCFFEAGEEQTVQDMIKCIEVASGNDAAVAMAEHLAGSEAAFVQKMNERAKELGMEHTHFDNACGLEVETHLTSARDIAIMSRQLLLYHPDILTYSTIWMDSITHKTRRGESQFDLANTNKFLNLYTGANGLKTGYTSQAKYCMSATATRDGVTLIAVVMGAETKEIRNSEAMKLLDYGFAQCRPYVDTEVVPEDLQIFIGAGISLCCFEAGMEVAEAFAEYWTFAEDYITRTPEDMVNGKCHIDIKGINQEQLELMGIPTDQIRDSEHSTCCEPQLFCSYRREGGTYMRMGGGLCMKEK